MIANLIPALASPRQATAVARSAAAVPGHEMPAGDLVAGLAGLAGRAG